MMVKRKPPIQHVVKAHKREGKMVASFKRGTGPRTTVNQRRVKNPKRRVKYREMQQVDFREVPERDTYDQFYDKGWSWRLPDDVTLDDLSETGYSREELGWLEKLLIHRPPKNEIYAKRVIPPGRVRRYEEEVYYKLTWRPEKGRAKK